MSRHLISASDTKQTDCGTSRQVWLLVRHISGGHPAEIGFCSVVATQLTAQTFRTVLLDCKKPPDAETGNKSEKTPIREDIILGMNWEVERIGYKYELKEQPSVLKISTIQAEWESFSGQLIGTIPLTDDDIQLKGHLPSRFDTHC